MFRDRPYEVRRLQAKVDELQEAYSALLCRLNVVQRCREQAVQDNARLRCAFDKISEVVNGVE